jgi:predicted TIM-barrel fold metal-dependent hydrolase
MLILEDEFNVVHNFVLCDAHTHLRINTLEGLVPSEFVRKYSKTVREIALDIHQNPDRYRYKFPWELSNKPTDYYSYCQKDAYSVIHPGIDLVKSLDKYIGFDFFITFSANMTSRRPRDYRSANSKVREALIEKSPLDFSPHNNFRFIGFGRLDPNHSDALDAFDNAFQLGLRGLKLHPKEEDFEIESQKTEEILKRAAQYNMPVIFHTQEGMAAKILEVVSSTIKDLIDSQRTDTLTRLKVILGHAPWNGVSNKKLFEILSHPNIFGELSTLRPESYKEFFENSKSQIGYDRMFEAEHLDSLDRGVVEEMYYRDFGYNRMNYWSSKLMYGSDTPYPPSISSPELLKYLFSRDFIGTASDLQNILGVSALRLIPPIAKPNMSEGKYKASTGIKYHLTQLEQKKRVSKALGMDPILDSYPRARISSAIFSFMDEGKTRSWMFRSLFETKKPHNLVIPNPYGLSGSSVITGKITLTKEIERNLGKGGV